MELIFVENKFTFRYFTHGHFRIYYSKYSNLKRLKRLNCELNSGFNFVPSVRISQFRGERLLQWILDVRSQSFVQHLQDRSGTSLELS